MSGLAAAALILAFSVGGSRLVRAENPDGASVQEMVVAPVVRAMAGFAERLTQVEASVTAMAVSFTAKQVTTQQLCVSDESGAQTCISKAQLDALLHRYAQAEASPPAAAEGAAAPAGITATAEQPSEPQPTTAQNETTDHSQPEGVAQETPAAAPEPSHDPVIEPAAPPMGQTGQIDEPVPSQAEPTPPQEEAALPSEPNPAEARTSEPAPTETAAAPQTEPAQLAGSPAEHDDGTVQANTATTEPVADAGQTAEIVTLPNTPQQDADEPVVTGGIASSGPAGEADQTPPPAISAPETQPATE
jgi:hypothetical protein